MQVSGLIVRGVGSASSDRRCESICRPGLAGRPGGSTPCRAGAGNRRGPRRSGEWSCRPIRRRSDAGRSDRPSSNFLARLYLIPASFSLPMSCGIPEPWPECTSCGPTSMRHASPAARAIRTNPVPTTTVPVARATRSPAGARRSTVMAAPKRAIARRSMTPMTSRIAVRPAQQ